ncbi:MAG TPA: CvpA family protein [Phnomibacter sp.]|nr:CvpA family protein [Phnomibacter sp.]
MGIDIFVLALLAMAVIAGLRKGFVVGLFSLLAFVIGAAAALKLSGLAGAHLAEAFPGLKNWIPIVSFILVFVVVVIATRLLAKLIEETLEWTMLGWLNKLGGVLFFSLLYMLLASILLFYADKMGMLSAETKAGSQTYSMLAPLAPTIMEGLGKLIPIFKDLFAGLERAFENVANASPKAG